MSFIENITRISKLKTGLLWTATIFYMTLIFYLSSLPKIGDYELPYGADKIIHFFEYAVLGFLLSNSLRITGIRRCFLVGWIFATLYGISDEIHQSFVPMRDASIYDVVADSIGSFAGVYICRKCY